MKFRGHETFFIRKGWLGKGLKNISKQPDVFVTKEENPMDILGIGSNMVKSLRYWMQATGLSTEPKSGKRTQSMTDWGKLIYKHDPYIEELGTLLLLQYKLATNYDLATAWYFFFQKFNMQEFTKDDFVRALDNYITLNHPETAHSDRVLTDDFNCIVNTYVPRYKSLPGKVSPENNIDSPLGELGLIDILNKEKKIYRKTAANAKIFHPWIVMAMILAKKKGNMQEIELKELLHGPDSIGKVFNLDSLTLLDILSRAEAAGIVKIVRTAGLDVIHILHNYTETECIENYYMSLQENENKTVEGEVS